MSKLIPVFWDVTLCRLGQSTLLRLHYPDAEDTIMLRNLGNIYPSIRYNISQDLYLQQTGYAVAQLVEALR